jgi:hypothetical protein
LKGDKTVITIMGEDGEILFMKEFEGLRKLEHRWVKGQVNLDDLRGGRYTRRFVFDVK